MANMNDAAMRLRDLRIPGFLRTAVNNAIASVVDSGVFIGGEKVDQFEELFADYLGASHLLAVDSCSNALYLALKALGIGKGDSVITTPLSWLISSTAIARVGADPIFVDTKWDYLLDEALIEKSITSTTKAVLVVHYYGRSCKMDVIQDICERHSLLLIEDVAQAFGGEYCGKKLGTFGDAGCFSFSPMKLLPTLGDAGAIAFRSSEHYEFCLSLRHCGTDSSREICNHVSSKFLMDSINASVGLSILPFYDQLLDLRFSLAYEYIDCLSGTKLKFLPLSEISGCRENLFYDLPIYFLRRDWLMECLGKFGFPTKIRHPLPISDQPVFSSLASCDLNVARHLTHNTFCVPMHYNLTVSEIRKFCDATKFILR